MGILDDLFKSPGQRKIDDYKKIIKAKRNAENAIYETKGRVEKLETDNAKSWSKARELMKSGRKSAARMELCQYRANERLIEQLQKKTWITNFYLTRLESAKTDAALTSALGEMSKLIDIDPNKTFDVIGEVQGRLDEATEIDRIWDSIHASETREDSRRDSDQVPGVDELMRELEREAAGDVGGKLRSDADVAKDDEIARGVAEGREKLNNILDAEDKRRP